MTENKDANQKNESDNQEEVDLSKRQFIKTAGMTTGGIVGGILLGSFISKPFKTEKYEPASGDSHHHGSGSHNTFTEAMQFFTRSEDLLTLAAATEIIFPEDENGPGAIALGAPYYIDKQLASPWGKNTDDYRKRPFLAGESPLNRGDTMLTGLRKLNEVSQSKHNDIFDNLEEDAQIEILQSFEAGEIEMNLVSSVGFFALLRQLTLEGCYADPLYGGNKDMEGWRMREFPGAYMSYVDTVEAKEFVKKEPMSLSDHM
ncbi:gluconate 2-dehydrogenase subunit 3 family protein [Oceanobacillus sojae]|uniref:gluconate 2-dehydrogenase subunit 3 family protein n=1 Tax=Oceanobacillus sojae TaxID=582851 RepID=UPI0021A76241|nr:gluconate 2-dehydrogenase subunit 3 family protein [Oceanobacillus sojae]MCT1904498.1 gluconate 2-dehydrogenase subunit 3 family protein [Oceanobacillus sojae]